MKKLKTISVAVALAISSTAHAIEVSGGAVQSRLYGQVELISLYEIDQNIADGSSKAGLFGMIPTKAISAREFDGEGLSFTANTSRLGVIAEYDSGVRVRVEGDFYDGFRLRHAYGEYGNWLAGQTWTNVYTTVGRIQTIDFEGLTGRALEDRAPQIKYTTGPVSIAIEEADFTGTVTEDFKFACFAGDGLGCTPDLTSSLSPSQSNENSRSTTKLPVVTARYEDEVINGLTLSVAGIIQEVKAKTDATGSPRFSDYNLYQFDYRYRNNGERYQVDDSLVGHAVFVASDFEVTNALTLHGTVFHSNGANSYSHASGSNFGFTAPDAVINTVTGQMEALESFGGTVGATVKAGPGYVGLGYGITRIKWGGAVSMNDDSNKDTFLTKRNENAFLNYAWEPVEGLTTGIEYGYFSRTLINSDDGEAHRVLANAVFSL